MWNLLKAELLKLRRCQILWVGLVALALCPLVQYGSQLIVEAEYRNPNYDFSTLFENVVWGNTQMFFPISLVMIGSWLIDRESTHDTLKNIMTIPVSMPKMLGAKLFWVGIFAVLLGIYSVGVTLITGLTVGLSGLTVEVFFHGGTQIVLAALTTYLVCMPLILIESMQKTMQYLCENIQGCVLGYTQSDEITLLLIDYKRLNSDAWFDYEVQKMCSIAASMTTMAFNRYFAEAAAAAMEDGVYAEALQKAVQKGAMFDARCFNVPKEETANLIYWRQLDAARNSVQMVGQANFSHKQLQGKSCEQIQDMLMQEKMFNWNELETCLKRGSCCVRKENAEAGKSNWIIDREIPQFKGDGREYIEKRIFVGES